MLKPLDRDIPLLLEKRCLSPGTMVIDGDRVAVFVKLTPRRRDVGHAIGYRIAQFFRVCDKKMAEYVSLIDSFGAVEQVLGHPLAPPDGGRGESGDLLAV